MRPLKYTIPNNGGIQLTGLKEAPTFRMDSYVVRYLESKERCNQGLSPETVAIRHLSKCIYPCEGRGTTDEAFVMEVEEQPQV